MPARVPPAPVDHVVLADALSVLGYPLRLEIMEQLRFPRSPAEVRVTPTRTDDAGRPERAVARQTVLYHLEKLVEAGLVKEEGGRFVTDPKKMYAVTEELRRLCLAYAGRGPAGDATGTLAEAPPDEQGSGPRLVLAHGVYEGKHYPLVGKGPWRIGRQRGLSVALDYDPFVSSENALIECVGEAYVLQDRESSKNGTSVNWVVLAPGARRTLRVGDLIGVGRSLLLFLQA